MALQLGPVIGKIGGADLTSTAVSGESSSGMTWETIHTVTVPIGETWLIAAVGDLASTTTLSGRPGRLRVGDQPHVEVVGTTPQPVGTAAAIEGPADINIQLSNASNAGSPGGVFDGHVYTVPLPD